MRPFAARFHDFGLPDILQIDNDGAFTGLGDTKPVFGKIVRLLLYLGIEVIFIPPGEPKRNHLVERTNQIWVQSFWDKDRFTSRADLLRKSPKFLTWYETNASPALNRMSVMQSYSQQSRSKLSHRQEARVPEKLPLTAGRIHFIRKVDAGGEINILKEQWRISKSLSGKYVWATIELSRKELLLYYRQSARA